MEGNWRVAPVIGAAVIWLAIAAAGCGSDSSGSDADAIETRNPEATFAPLIQLDPDERWLPMGAAWFLDRASFWFAEDQGCEDRKIAVGDLLYEEWTPVVDSLSHKGLGTSEVPYFRTPYGRATPGKVHATTGTTCPFREGYKYYANQQTRPYERTDRVKGLRLGEGYYLNLTDRARKGQRPRKDGKEIAVTAYVERHAEEVDGERGLRLTYWQLYGMNEPRGARGPVERRTHEGDWERLDVLLQESDDDEYVPVAVRIHSDEGARELRWASLQRTAGRRSDSSAATHPILAARLGDHMLSLTPRGRSCTKCLRWRTWSSLAPLQKEHWYGFGGAWGPPGATSETTGPLGPHGEWPPDSPLNAET
jgi:hypothetical protein